jgi:hypothetical protein
MKKIPKGEFYAICIKPFNLQPGPGGKFIAWRGLETLNIYKMKLDERWPQTIKTRVKVVSAKSGYPVGSYEDGFNIAVVEKFATPTVPYFWDHFVIL